MSIFREHKTIADRSASDRQRHKRVRRFTNYHISKKNQVEVACLQCNTLFSVKASYAKRVKYCSLECTHNSRKNAPRRFYKERIEITCVICDTKMFRTPCMRHIRFCSSKCRGIALKKDRISSNCLQCNITLIGRKRQTVFCSQHCRQISMSSGVSQIKSRQTCLKKYGVEFISQLSSVKKLKRETMKYNFSYRTSKVENHIGKLLREIYGNDAVDDQIRVNGWSIDFYLRSLDLFIQVDGVYWHGLDRSIDAIQSSSLLRDKMILKTHERDNEQNDWFSKNGLKLIRITDKDIKANLKDSHSLKLRVENFS